MRKSDSPIISFKDFTFQYRAQKTPTIKNINLDIFPGERVLIVGPSGSGKSTIANCINGLIPFSFTGQFTGSLTIDGIDAPNSGIFELSKSVGTVLQDPDGQFIGLTVGEDIAFSLENDCVNQDEMFSLVDEASSLVNVDDLLKKSPQELSGGQKQRVSLAGVMVDKVKILLFDEPLANLDPQTGKQTIELIDSIQEKTDTTVVIIEHRIEDVLWRKVDRIILISDGEIAADVTPNEILSGELLKNSGIREPLYITALKYAGVNVSKEKNPEHVDSVILSEEDKALVKKWYLETKLEDKENKNENILEIKNLSFGYYAGELNLDNINFEIKKGEMVSIVGRNGAGKSTLAKLICGFENTEKGSIILNGRDISNEPIRKRASMIGYVMQDPNQMISKTMIYDEVALGLSKSGLSEDEIKERVHETLKVCGLYPFRNWPISALSFGQKKRVTIASVLVMGPEVIILDEPTAGQDFKHYTDIMEFLSGLNQKGVTVLMITHDMHLMLEYTKRALVFDKGHLIADDSSSKILCSPDITKRAALKETSLYTLAKKVGIDDETSFVDHFIGFDRKERA